MLSLGANHLVILREVDAIFGSLKNSEDLVADPKRSWAILNLDVCLQVVVDLTEESNQQLLNTSFQELTGNWRIHKNELAPTQKLGEALFSLGIEGFISPSAKAAFHRNLTVFPENLQKGSTVAFHDPLTGKTHSLLSPRKVRTH
jgi:hypothetical protein